MLGDALLVAPIFAETGEVEYYLPPGKWTNYFTRENVPGYQWHKEQHDYFSLPLLVRENTILPVGATDNSFDYDFADNVDLQVYNLIDNKPCSRTVYGPNGDSELQITIVKEEGEIKVTLGRKTMPTDLRQSQGIPSEACCSLRGGSSVVDLAGDLSEKQILFSISS